MCAWEVSAGSSGVYRRCIGKLSGLGDSYCDILQCGVHVPMPCRFQFTIVTLELAKANCFGAFLFGDTEG